MAVYQASQTIIDLTDGYSVSLSQDSVSWNGTTTNLGGSGQTISITVTGYQGSSIASSYSIGTPTCTDSNNCTAAVSGTTVNITVKAAATKGGSVTIPVNFTSGSDTVTINKTFTYGINLTGATGAAGKGISSTTITYGTSSSASTTPTSWSSTAPTSFTKGTWLWTKVVIAYTDGSASSTSYSKAYIGTDGTKGDDGDDGRGISSTTITYGTSSSASTTPSSWSGTAPTSLTKGTWLWTKVYIVYTDNTNSTSYSKAYIGTDGDDGEPATVISITGNNYIRNSSNSVTLTANVFYGGNECTISDAGVVTYGSKTLGTVKWYKGDATTGTAGKTFPVAPGEVTNSLIVYAKLEA